MKSQGNVFDSVVSRCSHIFGHSKSKHVQVTSTNVSGGPDARFSAILVRVSLLSGICADVWLVRFE